jgi:hypothetical protein
VQAVVANDLVVVDGDGVVQRRAGFGDLLVLKIFAPCERLAQRQAWRQMAGQLQ